MYQSDAGLFGINGASNVNRRSIYGLWEQRGVHFEMERHQGIISSRMKVEKDRITITTRCDVNGKVFFATASGRGTCNEKEKECVSYEAKEVEVGLNGGDSCRSSCSCYAKLKAGNFAYSIENGKLFFEGVSLFFTKIAD